MAQTPGVPERTGAAAAFTTDVDGRVQSWTREAEELFGYTVEDIANRSWAILLAADVDSAADANNRPPAAHATVRRFRRQDRTEFAAHHATLELTSFTGIVMHAQLLVRIQGVEHVAATAERRRGSPPAPTP